MKSIEQKLKLDARAFKMNPDQKLHDNIMHKINNSKRTQQNHNALRKFHWLIPTGFAMAALILVVMNITPNEIDETVSQPNFNKNIVKLSKLNINALSSALESNLVSNIQAEQKAIQADLKYFKTIFSLNKS